MLLFNFLSFANQSFNCRNINNWGSLGHQWETSTKEPSKWDVRHLLPILHPYHFQSDKERKWPTNHSKESTFNILMCV